MAAIVPQFTLEMAKVLSGGAQKYDRDQWMNGLSFAETMDSLKRHVNKLERGLLADEEFGTHEAAHIAINAMFMYWLTTNRERYKKFDDLPYVEVPDAG